MEQSQVKKCGRCQECKPLSEFYHNASRKDGFDPYCKICKIAYRMSHAEQGWASRQRAYYANVEEKRAMARRRMRLRRALMTMGKEEDSLFAKQWELLCMSNAYRCFCCGREKPLHIDHIVPVVQGGTDDITNLQPLCALCNRRKGDRFVDYRKNPNSGK